MNRIPLKNVNSAQAAESTTFLQSGAQLYVCGSNYYAGGDLRITASENYVLGAPYALSDIREQVRDAGVFRTEGGEALFVIAENGSVLVRGQASLGSLGCGEQILRYEAWTPLAEATQYNEITVGRDSVAFTFNPCHAGLYDGQTEKDFEKAVNILWVLFGLLVATIVAGIAIFLFIFLCRANKRGGVACACCVRANRPERESLISKTDSDKQE